MTDQTHRFDELVNDLDVSRVNGMPTIDISSVCYDSRLAEPGSLFVALHGGYTDGHVHLSDARSRGSVAALVERWTPDADSFEACVQVPDTRSALARVASRFYREPGAALGVIGVTGTDGKTTTTFLIDSILRQSGLRTGVIGTVIVRIDDEITDHDTRQTTPESLEIQQLLAQMRDTHVDWAILEATSHGLAMHRLDTCPFDIGVVTNITHEHLDFHGSIEGYRRAKAILLESVAAQSNRRFPHGVVINDDDEGARSIASYAGSQPMIRFSMKTADVDVYGTDVQVDSRGTTFMLEAFGQRKTVRLNLIGDYNVANALASVGAAHIAGIDVPSIVAGLEGLQSVPGRLAAVNEGQPFAVFVDYAHTPDSLAKTMTLLRTLSSGRLIVVFGSAGERDRAKRPLQGAVAASMADFTVITSEDPRFEDPDQIIAEIAAGAYDAGAREGVDVVCCEDRRVAIETAFNAARPGDIVLLAGKGHEKCMIYGSERRPWDEAAVASALLRSHLASSANGMRRG